MLFVYSDVFQDMFCYEKRDGKMYVGAFNVRTGEWIWEVSIFRTFSVVRDIYDERIVLDEA